MDIFSTLKLLFGYEMIRLQTFMCLCLHICEPYIGFMSRINIDKLVSKYTFLEIKVMCDLFINFPRFTNKVYSA